MIVELFGNIYNKFFSFSEKFLVALSLGAFIIGVLLAGKYAGFGEAINNGAGSFIDWYGVIAPFAIFLILAPSLSRMLLSKAGKFGAYAVVWLGIRRFLATIWAAVFTVLIFGFPLLPQGDNVSIAAALQNALGIVLKMMIVSPFMQAIWVGIIIAFISVRVNWIARVLDKILNGFEAAGRHFIPIVPFFMMAIGAYVVNLPTSIGDEIKLGEDPVTLHTFNVFGLNFDPNTAFGMVSSYLLGALLVGLGCIIWHYALLLLVKHKVKGFSIKRYFTHYWIRVYPLLWSTSSEALSTPLNLYLTKKYYPEIHRVVRRFVVGMGSYLNINGTLIAVFVLGGLVTSMLGLEPSLLEWFLVIPIVFLLGYGVPGIPGELILFAGPIGILLGLSPEVTPIFLALYIGLQVGLPDSFRTGNNSTDNVACALLLNSVYEERFAGNVEASNNEASDISEEKSI